MNITKALFIIQCINAIAILLCSAVILTSDVARVHCLALLCLGSAFCRNGAAQRRVYGARDCPFALYIQFCGITFQENITTPSPVSFQLHDHFLATPFCADLSLATDTKATVAKHSYKMMDAKTIIQPGIRLGCLCQSITSRATHVLI